MRRKRNARIKIQLRRLEEFARCCGAQVVWSSRLSGVFGQVDQGQIALRNGLSPEQALHTLVHELTHLLMHCHASPRINRTVCEYEAEAVERWVSAALEANEEGGWIDPSAFTDDLLATSIARVQRAASILIYVARQDPDDWRDPSRSESEAAIKIDTPTGEEVVLHDELYRMRNLIGLAKPL
jgi:hypothetical protein